MIQYSLGGGDRLRSRGVLRRPAKPGDDELGAKLINMIAFTNLQQFSEAIGNCDKSLCLHAKIQQV